MVLTHERRVAWFAWRDGEYGELAADSDGVIRSAVFPGLWLSVPALWQGDLAALLATVQQGMATPQHRLFVEEQRTLG